MEKDIKLAIQLEEEYLHRKVNLHDGTANIYEYLNKAGYDNIDEYNNDAQEYIITSQDYVVVEEPYINIEVALPYMQAEKPALLYAINCGEKYGFVPNSYDNESLLLQYGYKQIKLGYDNSNGPILSADGDLRIFIVLKKHPYIDIDNLFFHKKLKNLLLQYYDDVKIDNNDILINDKKICGGIINNYNSNILIVVFQINFIDKYNDIINICGKSQKIPGFIDNKLLDAEKIKNEFIKWLHIQ